MIARLPFLALLLGLTVPAWPQDDAQLLEEELRREIMEKSRVPKPRAPELDPRRIINESNSFLREREPEMTAEEYALYEKSVRLLGQRPEFAVRLLEAMTKEGEKPSAAFSFILANAYYLGGDATKAEEAYQAAVAAYPTFLRAWVNLGILYHSSGRFGEAAKAFGKALSLGDRDPETCGLLGYSLEQAGDPIGAEVAYMQALAADPANLDWKEGLLRVCLQGQQLARAEAIVRTLIREHPEEVRFWLVYANLLLTDQRKLQAIAVLQTAAATASVGPDEFVLLGDLYAEQGLVAEAVESYQKVSAVRPELAGDKLQRFAGVLIATRRLQEAASVIDQLASSGTDAVRRYQLKAELHLAREEWAEARHELEALLQLAPLNGPALLALGRTYVAEEDFARAALAIEAAAQVPETTYRACLELANLSLRSRDYGKCCELLERALALHRTDAVADYLARIKPLVAAPSTNTP